jgi:hypothetical protein
MGPNPVIESMKEVLLLEVCFVHSEPSVPDRKLSGIEIFKFWRQPFVQSVIELGHA